MNDVVLPDLYCLPNTVCVIKLRKVIKVGPVASSSEERNANRVLVGKPEGKRPLGRPRNTSSSSSSIMLRSNLDLRHLN